MPAQAPVSRPLFAAAPGRNWVGPGDRWSDAWGVFIYELDVPVIVGGCATYTAALHLMRTGAAGV
ncbi:hypothetical protein AB0E96_16930, partial [Kitasatospora sp. NPDC036755]|uniref:hypothetical protein n=1 Tax=Kitasatospora sp. NPDC036755 TaxID=3154600 RepID=UPI0033EC78B0